MWSSPMIAALLVSYNSPLIIRPTPKTVLVILTTLLRIGESFKGCNELLEIRIIATRFVWMELECTFEVCSANLCNASIFAYAKNCVAIHSTQSVGFREKTEVVRRAS